MLVSNRRSKRPTAVLAEKHYLHRGRLMARITPEEAAEKLARRLKGATADIERGVRNVSVSPTAAAAAKKEKWLAGITEAANNGKWEARLRAVTKEDWQTKMLSKGIPRIAAGIDAAKDKVTEFYSQLFPFQDRLVAKIKQMPDTTLEDSINRMGEFARGMANFQRE